MMLDAKSVRKKLLYAALCFRLHSADVEIQKGYVDVIFHNACLFVMLLLNM